MKKNRKSTHSLFFTAVLLAFSPLGLFAQASFDHNHEAFTTILKTYVNEEGMVNYEKLKKERAGLDSYVMANSKVTQAQFDKWTETEQIVFLTNVYNSETLQLIIDHLPIKSIKDIGGRFRSPWKTKSVELFGETTTLDHVEHGLLRKDYNEPRVHFALVCAAIGCPPLRAEAFTSEKMDAQFDDQAKVFLAQSEKNNISGNTLNLSPIFKWFTEDFTKDGKTLDQYVDPYIEGSSVGKKLDYTHYDWNLNKQ